jgi:cytochrome c peroxidase
MLGKRGEIFSNHWKINNRPSRYMTMNASTVRDILLILLLIADQGLSRAQSVAVLDGQPENGNLTISLTDTNSGQVYWRVERSSNLVDWVRWDTMETLDGVGGLDMSWALIDPAPGYSYRMVSDSSVSNVLSLPASPFNYSNIPLPAHLLDPAVAASDNTPPNNQITDAGATLGRVLFYDKKLSVNHTISCSSCHIQQNGFSDPDAFSAGFEGGLTGRNSMGLTSAKYYQRAHFFWDERAATLEIQTLQPIQHAVEMGMTLTGLISRIDNYTYYDQLFISAFGDSTITTQRIARALSQFVRSMVSYQTKFDAGVPVGFTNFTPLEVLGQQIFNGPRGNCATCHGGPNFVGVRIENNGLEFPYIDTGVGGITGLANEMGKFKMSSLRNIEFTAPYMHDGRFATLEEVVNHYSTGVVANVNLGPTLMQPGPPGQPPVVRRPNFTPQERDALVAFMKTLTDMALMTEPKFSDPF